MKSGLPDVSKRVAKPLRNIGGAGRWNTLREIRRIYELLTSGPTLDRPQYVLNRDVAQRPAETGNDPATFGHTCGWPNAATSHRT